MSIEYSKGKNKNEQPRMLFGRPLGSIDTPPDPPFPSSSGTTYTPTYSEKKVITDSKKQTKVIIGRPLEVSEKIDKIKFAALRKEIENGKERKTLQRGYKENTPWKSKKRRFLF